MPWETGGSFPFGGPAFPGGPNFQQSVPLWPSLPKAPGDELWWDGFALPIVDGSVFCVAEYQGSIVVGGSFRGVGRVQVDNIARWDGTEWSGLGAGVEGSVFALSVHDGDLIAGGSFSSAGGVAAQNVARWNGQAWSALGEGLHYYDFGYGSVGALVSHGDELIAGGEFLLSGSRSVRAVARWNGASWDSMGSGLAGYVRSLVVSTDDVYAGGSFTSSGSTPLSHVARWDGAEWRDVGGGVRQPSVYGDYAQVNALASYGGNLIAGGYFDHAGDSTVSHLAEWNGSEWRGLGTFDGVTALGVSQNTLFVSGSGGGLSSWDGASWVTIDGLQGYAQSIVGVGAELFVGGYLRAGDASTNVKAYGIARYSGGTWHDLARWDGRMNGLAGDYLDRGRVTSLGSHLGKLVAAGSFSYPADPPAWVRSNGIASWDGARWTDLPVNPALPYYGGITCLLSRDDTLYAGGYYSYYDTTGQVRPVYRFVGNQWTPLGASRFIPSTLATYAGSLFAAGHDTGFSDSTTSVYQWTGTSWRPVGTLSGFQPHVSTMSVVDGRLVVCGRFSAADGVPVSNIAQWDMLEWKPFGSPLPIDFFDETHGTVHQGKFVATGPLSVVLRWNGSSWEIMGSLLVSNAVVASTGGELFVGGYLRRPDEPYVTYGVARWDGHDWVEMGSGTNGPVEHFQAHDGALYMSGSFTRAGGTSAYAIARWDGLAAPAPAPAFLSAAPNPFRAVTQFSYRVTTPGSVRIAVFDLHGREVSLLEHGGKPSGTHSVEWKGQDKNGRQVASGVYFIRAALPGGDVLSRKIVRVR